jgi:hypothetical protein
MGKEELIHKTYQDLLELDDYNQVKPFIDLNGWLPMRNLPKYFDLDQLIDKFSYDVDKELDFNKTSIRPIKLKGIEDNNGWVVINTEDDLPKQDCDCFIIFYGGKIIRKGYSYSQLSKEFSTNYKDYKWNLISHYQIVKEPIGLPLI